MGTHLAIATVTATLQRTLQAVVQTDVEGARITTVSPSEIGQGTPETGVNIFMYQAITNPALHNMDVSPLRTKGNSVNRQAALDLYYMFSFYGNNNELAPQRLLGSVIRVLNDRRVLTADLIRDACADSTFSFLRASTLADQVQQISIVPLDLNLEDLSKTWSVFFQTPYVLSIAYKVLVVLVEGDVSFRRGLPVRDRRHGGMAAFPAQPQIERIQAETGPQEPILPDSTLVITGKHLKGDRFTQVRLGGVEVTPATVEPTRITLPLPMLAAYALRAGVQSLQVIHPTALVEIDRPAGRRGAESNAAAFVLRPRTQSVTVSEIVETDDDLRSATLTVQVTPTVGAQQRVVVSLNEWSVDNPASYLFNAPRRERDTDTVTIPLQDLKPGIYLVRLLVDGAESQLVVDTDETSPTFDWYIGPRIEVI